MIRNTPRYSASKRANLCVLILASGYTRSNYSKWRKKSFSHLNSGTKLATNLIKGFYNQLGLEVFIGINNLEDYKNICDINSCEIIHLPMTDNPCDSIRHCISCLTAFDEIILNPVTVIPSLKELDSEIIYLGDKKIYKENWSSIDFVEKLPRFYFRDNDEETATLSYPFTGIISCKLAHLKDALAHVTSLQNKDLGYLAYYLHSIYRYQFKLIKWLDLDHETTHCDAKLHAISSRDFHNLKYLDEEKIITKTKSGLNSLYHDFIYYKSIPAELRRYYPCLINYSTDVHSSTLSLEYIPYPTLAELYLHGELGKNRWTSIIKTLKNICDKFYNREPVKLRENVSYLYSKKLEKRMNKIIEHDRTDNDWEAFNYILKNEFVLNGERYPSLLETTEILTKFLKQYEVSRALFFGHGDFCFNNILVDPSFMTTKLIDPRVDDESNIRDIGLIDPYYDYAKLNHSFSYYYDCIVNQLYRLMVLSKNQISLDVYKPSDHRFIKDLFEDNFFKTLKDRKEISLITSSLFLSMLPIHLEDPKRITAFSLIGMQICFSFIEL